MKKQITYLIIIICIFGTFGTTYAFVDTIKNEEISDLTSALEQNTLKLTSALELNFSKLNNNMSDLKTQLDLVSNIVGSIFWIQTSSLPPVIDIDEYKKGDVEFETYLEDSYFIGNWIEENGNIYSFLEDGTYIKTGSDHGGLKVGTYTWRAWKEPENDEPVFIVYTSYSSHFSCKFYYDRTHLLLSSHGTGYTAAYLKKIG